MSSIFFPTTLSASFYGLSERYFLTPSKFSEFFFMRIILPKQYQPKINVNCISQQSLNSDLLWRMQVNFPYHENIKTIFESSYAKVCNTHTLHVTSRDGIERIELISKKPASKYIIYFVGNADDSMRVDLFEDAIREYPDCNFIFWNYPGVGWSTAHNASVYDLFSAGLQQVQALRERQVPMKNILLRGSSLGGGIALQVLRRLPQNQDLPDISIERSFSATSAVGNVQLTMLLDSQPKKKPLLSSVLACAILGISIGLIVSGIIATVSLLLATLIAALGYVVAGLIMSLHDCLQYCLPGHISSGLACVAKFAECVNQSMTQCALWTHSVGDGFASIIGVCTAAIALLVGIVCGTLIGVLLSVQLLFTDIPCLSFSLGGVTRLLACVGHAQMDSVAALQVILQSQNPPAIKVYNTEDDEVIPADAALCTGLQFTPKVDPNTALSPQISKHIQCFWYQSGRHNMPMSGLVRSSSEPCI